MQKFQLLFSYYNERDALTTLIAEAWAKSDRDAMGRVRDALPKGGKLVEAWMVEWQNPDAPMELLFGHNKEPDPRLKEMVAELRNSKISSAVQKARNRAGRFIKQNASDKPEPVLTVPHAAKPYRAFTIFSAVSWRKWYDSQQKA